MAEIIATGTTQVDSADFTLADGQSANLYLKDAAGPDVTSGAIANVQIKSGAEYFTVGSVTGYYPCMVLRGTGTYRVRKLASTDAFGVDKD
jgi:hypothetical protein